MLLSLHSSIVQNLKDESTIEGLENLAQARREGRHMVFADRGTLESIIAADHISTRARATFSVVYQRLAEKKSFVQTLCRSVEVVSDDYGVIASRRVGNKIVIQVPVGLLDTEMVQRTLLIGENLKDVEIFSRMAMVYAHREGMKCVPLSFESIGGGGSTTADIYARYQSSGRRMCVCVVDSDRNAPASGTGETARKLLQADSSDRPLSEVTMLEARELENLLPLAVLQRIRGVNAGAIADLENLISSSVAEARAYVEIKDGTCVKDLVRYPEGSPERAYWLQVLGTLMADIQAIREDCIVTTTCGASNACRCVINAAFGSNVLELALEVFQQTSLYKLSECLDATIDAEWNRIGALILSWCCGAPSLRAA